jgi:hypothetical protein
MVVLMRWLSGQRMIVIVAEEGWAFSRVELTLGRYFRGSERYNLAGVA